MSESQRDNTAHRSTVKEKLIRMWEKSRAIKLKDHKHKNPLSPIDPDIVTVHIDDINQAKTLVIEDAKARALTLDWGKFGIDNLHQVKQLLDVSYPLALRQADLGFNLNLLNANNLEERTLLEGIADERKSSMEGGFWLAMFSETITAEEATIMRDYLWTVAPGIVATMKHLPEEKMMFDFVENHPSFLQAFNRVARYVKKR